MRHNYYNGSSKPLYLPDFHRERIETMPSYAFSDSEILDAFEKQIGCRDFRKSWCKLMQAQGMPRSGPAAPAKPAKAKPGRKPALIQTT